MGTVFSLVCLAYQPDHPPEDDGDKMSEGDRISEGAESASETASTPTPRPPSTTPSEATSTSYVRQPGRYKKRAHSETLSDIGFTSEEEDDLDMDDLEDNDSSGMSHWGQGVKYPAGTLRRHGVHRHKVITMCSPIKNCPHFE